MKESSQINVLALFAFCFSFSCNNSVSHNIEWTKEEMSKFLDSLEVTHIIAAYNDDGGLTLMIKHNKIRHIVLKATYQLNFPTIVDTLVQTETNAFTSHRFRTQYVISNNEVVATWDQKIIHPSSNWQGQTPWREAVIMRYPRLDAKSD